MGFAAVRHKKLLYSYWAMSALALAFLAFAGPRGWLLTPAGARGKAERRAQIDTVRSRGPVFVWAGGGYHGGK